MNFDDVLEKVLRDERSHMIPILFLIEVIIICDDLRLFKEADNECST